MAPDLPDSEVWALDVDGVGDFSFSFPFVLAEDFFGLSFAFVDGDRDVLLVREVDAFDDDLPRDLVVFFAGCGSCTSSPASTCTSSRSVSSVAVSARSGCLRVVARS